MILCDNIVINVFGKNGTFSKRRCFYFIILNSARLFPRPAPADTIQNQSAYLFCLYRLHLKGGIFYVLNSFIPNRSLGNNQQTSALYRNILKVLWQKNQLRSRDGWSGNKNDFLNNSGDI